MGLVLDSSALIAAEREKRPVSQLLSSLSSELSETEFLLSSISVMELEHGWHRANTPEARAENAAAISMKCSPSFQWNLSHVRWERWPRRSKLI